MTRAITSGINVQWPLVILLSLLAAAPPAMADDLPEYQLKAEYLYRFVQYTEWPSDVGNRLNLCVHGTDPFGVELDRLQGKAVESRTIEVMHNVKPAALGDCQIVFVALASAANVSSALERLNGRAALVVADAPGAARLGVALNMTVRHRQITFEANISAARANRISLSSRLLRLATEVIQ